MSDFNKGAHVRYTGKSIGYVDRDKLGWTGYVVDVGTGYSYINWGDSQNEVSNANLALVKGLPADPFDNDLEEPDMVNNPPHYTAHPSGVECIEITRHMGFNVGNAVKYLWRADLKGAAIQDLEKAAFYIQDEITKRKEASA